MTHQPAAPPPVTRGRWWAIWTVWIVAFLLIEAVALADRRRGDTLTEHVRRWIGTRDGDDQPPTGAQWAARGVLLALLVWLPLHFLWPRLGL